MSKQPLTAQDTLKLQHDLDYATANKHFVIVPSYIAWRKNPDRRMAGNEASGQVSVEGRRFGTKRILELLQAGPGNSIPYSGRA